MIERGVKVPCAACMCTCVYGVHLGASGQRNGCYCLPVSTNSVLISSEKV